jgi:hypothetical protein
VRQEAIAYVDAVVARAEGADGSGTSGARENRPSRKPLLARLLPKPVKRGLVHTLIYVMRHPFSHLMHPVQVRLEEEIGQARGIAQAALTRSEQTAGEVRRLRTELDRERRAR